MEFFYSEEVPLFNWNMCRENAGECLFVTNLFSEYYIGALIATKGISEFVFLSTTCTSKETIDQWKGNFRMGENKKKRKKEKKMGENI